MSQQGQGKASRLPDNSNDLFRGGIRFVVLPRNNVQVKQLCRRSRCTYASEKSAHRRCRFVVHALPKSCTHLYPAAEAGILALPSALCVATRQQSLVAAVAWLVYA